MKKIKPFLVSLLRRSFAVLATSLLSIVAVLICYLIYKAMAVGLISYLLPLICGYSLLLVAIVVICFCMWVYVRAFVVKSK